MSTEPEHADLGASAAAGDGLPEQPRHGKRGAPQAFARKLAEILSTESPDCISWNSQGSAFQVHDVERFSEDILTKYYRHSKFSSFQRQLNLYSFRKIVKGTDAGGYAHPMFRRDRPDDLYHVRRSISGSARYEPPAAAAKAAAKRNAAAAALKLAGVGAERAAPRAQKSSAAARRVGKLRNKAVKASSSAGGSRSSKSSTPSAAAAVAAGLVADHNQQAGAARQAGGGGGGGGVFSFPTDIISDAGERSPWTSGDSGGESDVSVKDAPPPATMTAKQATASKRAGRERNFQNEQRREADSSGETESSSSLDSDDDDAGSWESGEEEEEEEEGGEEEAPSSGDGIGSRRHRDEQQNSSSSSSSSSRERLFSCAAAADKEAGGDAGAALLDREGEEEEGGTQQQQGGGATANGGGGGESASAAPTRKSPFNFFKKTFSFMDRSSSHSRGMSTSSVDLTAMSAATAGVASHPERPISVSSSTDLGSSSSSSSNTSSSSSAVSPLMVDTSAAARAAAAGVGVSDRGVRPPPVTVTGGGHRIPIDAGNKALLSSPLTPRSSMEAAALAAAAAAAAAAASAAMPPPPKREQREELGLVEQLTNMVEVFDICDLLRKVSTSNSSRLDKHGGIVKPAGPQHLRNMSVDTDQGLPQSPLQGRDAQGQSPTGLGSLESMELVRESSKDWDTLMAGSADVSDLGNTMVQSVAEFFSF